MRLSPGSLGMCFAALGPAAGLSAMEGAVGSEHPLWPLPPSQDAQLSGKRHLV